MHNFIIGLIFGAALMLAAGLYAINQTAPLGFINTGFGLYKCRSIDINSIKLPD